MSSGSELPSYADYKTVNVTPAKLHLDEPYSPTSSPKAGDTPKWSMERQVLSDTPKWSAVTPREGQRQDQEQMATVAATTTTTVTGKRKSRDNSDDDAISTKRFRLTERQLRTIVQRTVFMTLTDGGAIADVHTIDRIATKMNKELASDLVNPRGFDMLYDP